MIVRSEEESSMCLAVPGKVLSTFDQHGVRMAKVQFGGVVREACLECVPEVQVGEYVLVHVGFALSRIDEAEAERTFEALRELDQLAELEAPAADGPAEQAQSISGKEGPGGNRR
ncbi:MAG: HypC/HybG/HupF family hydrogenase formation chaperone [Acidobacteriaceae bacterium]